MVHHCKHPFFFYLEPLPWGQCYTNSCPGTSTSCHPCTWKVWSCYVQQLKNRCIYKKNALCDLEMYPPHHYNLYTCRIWSCYDYAQKYRRRSIYKKIRYWPFTFTLGSKSYEVPPSTLIWLIHMQSLKVLCRRAQEKMHLHENTLFDLWPWP